MSIGTEEVLAGIDQIAVIGILIGSHPYEGNPRELLNIVAPFVRSVVEIIFDKLKF